MTKLTRAITKDEVAAYNNAGVVLLRNILDLSTVNTVRRCIDDAVMTLGESKSGYDLTELTKAYEAFDAQKIAAESDGQHDVGTIMDHMRNSGKPLLFDRAAEDKNGRFLLDTGVSSRLRDFQRFVRRGAAPEIASELLNANTVRFFGDQVFVKEPGTRERTAFHQDATYFEIDGDQCCVLWIPVDPVQLEHGAMVYVRGSHSDKKLYKPNVFVSQASLPGAEGFDLPDIEGNPGEYDLIHFDVEPGDVLVHHYRTLHGTGGNTSRYQVRRAASIRYCGDDIRVKSRPWAPRQLHHHHKLQDGEPLSGSDFPIVWTGSRPDQEAA